MAGKKSNIPDRELKKPRSITITAWKIIELEKIATREKKSFSDTVERGIDLLLNKRDK